MVNDYNKYILGVYKMDQSVSYYSFLHKSLKWWKKVFFWLIEFSVVNQDHAKKNGDSQIKHLAFCRRIIADFSEELHMTPGPQRGPRLPSVSRFQPAQHFPSKGRKRRDCVVCCDRKAKWHLTSFYCPSCSCEPALCPDECFMAYRTQQHIHS